MHFLSQQLTVVQIIPTHFSAGEMKNLAGILFFISLLTQLCGIIQIDDTLVESKAVAKKLGLLWIAAWFEEHMILTNNNNISQVPSLYRERQNNYETRPYSMDSKKGAGTGRSIDEAPGTSHEFQTWRKSMYGFTQLLFKD